MESLNWYLIAAAASMALLLGALWRSRRQRRQQSAIVALVTQRRKLRCRLIKLLGNDEATQAAQFEAQRLNVSSASLEALKAAVERAEKEREQQRARAGA